MEWCDNDAGLGHCLNYEASVSSCCACGFVVGEFVDRVCIGSAV